MFDWVRNLELHTQSLAEIEATGNCYAVGTTSPNANGRHVGFTPALKMKIISVVSCFSDVSPDDLSNCGLSHPSWEPGHNSGGCWCGKGIETTPKSQRIGILR